MRMAAIYARVSSEHQREAHTIGSQTTALIEWEKTLDLEMPTAWIFEDDGYSGATLERLGLERVRDLAAECAIPYGNAGQIFCRPGGAARRIRGRQRPVRQSGRGPRQHP